MKQLSSKQVTVEGQERHDKRCHACLPWLLCVISGAQHGALERTIVDLLRAGLVQGLYVSDPYVLGDVQPVFSNSDDVLSRISTSPNDTMFRENLSVTSHDMRKSSKLYDGAFQVFGECIMG